MFSILAAQAVQQPTQILPQQSQLIDTLVAAKIYCPILLCIIGGLLMIFGFKAYRWIVVLNFCGLGFLLGQMLGERSQIALIGGVIGAALATVIALPLMRYAVAVCGGLVGAVIGMVVWAYFEQPINMAWAGGLVGLAILGMLTFIWFKTTVILFTSIEGAAMFVLGTSALLMHYEPWSKDVANSLATRPVLLPLLVTSLTVLALFWQHQRHGLIGHEGFPAGAGGGVKPSASGDSKKK